MIKARADVCTDAVILTVGREDAHNLALLVGFDISIPNMIRSSRFVDGSKLYSEERAQSVERTIDSIYKALQAVHIGA